MQQQLTTSVRYTPPTPNADLPTTSSRSTGSSHSGPPGTARLLQDGSALGVCTRAHFAQHLTPVLWTDGGVGAPSPTAPPAAGLGGGAVAGGGRTVVSYIAGAAAAVDAQVLLRHGVTHAVLLHSPAAAPHDDNSTHNDDDVATAARTTSCHSATVGMYTAAACASAFVDLRVVHVAGVMASDAPQQGLCAQSVAQYLGAVHAVDPGACSVLLYEGPAAQAAAEMAVLLRLQATSGMTVFEALTTMLRARPLTVLQVCVGV